MNVEIDLLHPPPYRFDRPIIDAHCHTTTLAASERMIRAGGLYGVKKWLCICRLADIDKLRRRFGHKVLFNIWLDHRHPDDFIRTNLEIIQKAARAGARSIKFWYKPEFNQRSGFYFDDPRLDRIFEAIIKADLAVLVHIADPDIWWVKRYHDPDQYEAKKFTCRQLTNTLGRFPELRVMVAHMGGWPENLPFLENLLRRYPNCYLDTSGTKWIARELSAQAPAARQFMIEHADRLLFGSDLVAFRHVDVAHHASRYWVHRHLYENHAPVRSPIEDPDACGPVYVAGLDLPDAVLEKLYRENAIRLFKI